MEKLLTEATSPRARDRRRLIAMAKRERDELALAAMAERERDVEPDGNGLARGGIDSDRAQHANEQYWSKYRLQDSEGGGKEYTPDEVRYQLKYRLKYGDGPPPKHLKVRFLRVHAYLKSARELTDELNHLKATQHFECTALQHRINEEYQRACELCELSC